MMNHTQAAISIAFLTIIMTSGICSSSFNNKIKNINKRKSSLQESILEAFEKNDYEAWKKLVMDNSDLITVIKEREFAIFVEARNAARKGLYDRSIAMSRALEAELRDKMGAVMCVA